MRAVDTNVLVRLVVRDDANQVRAAEEFIGTGAWVSQLVLAETTWYSMPYTSARQTRWQPLSTCS
jgi:predicted nucleic-acid-binding protein